MQLNLYGRHLTARSARSPSAFIGRIVEQADGGAQPNASDILLTSQSHETFPQGFRAYLVKGKVAPLAYLRDLYELAEPMWYLCDGDVVRVDPAKQTLHVLYRKSSPFNSLLVTERCDNYCVMCSQPPRLIDDSYIVDELEEVVRLMSPDTREIGLTGGEPTLLGTRLVALIKSLKDSLPSTAVHVLSNGRRCAEMSLARAIGAIEHPDLMFGVPLYSDIAEEHDYLVQARGAFSEAVRGIINLKRWGVRVELRFVVMRDSVQRLPDFAEFVARNLRFVDHIALMGLELRGFARTNLDDVWVDPLDYSEQLAAAVWTLDRAGLNVSIYNHPLCVLDPKLHPYARKSISDWKNIYLEECEGCASRPECGGLFASATLRRSRGIRPTRERVDYA
jgi:His-Xaa-Ser system radical SAM maturase HxsC